MSRLLDNSCPSHYSNSKHTKHGPIFVFAFAKTRCSIQQSMLDRLACRELDSKMRQCESYLKLLACFSGDIQKRRSLNHMPVPIHI